MGVIEPPLFAGRTDFEPTPGSTESIFRSVLPLIEVFVAQILWMIEYWGSSTPPGVRVKQVAEYGTPPSLRIPNTYWPNRGVRIHIWPNRGLLLAKESEYVTRPNRGLLLPEGSEYIPGRIRNSFFSEESEYIPGRIGDSSFPKESEYMYGRIGDSSFPEESE